MGRADFMGVWGRSESKGERRREKRSNPKRRWRLLLIVIVYCIDWVLIVGWCVERGRWSTISCSSHVSSWPSPPPCLPSTSISSASIRWPPHLLRHHLCCCCCCSFEDPLCRWSTILLNSHKMTEWYPQSCCYCYWCCLLIGWLCSQRRAVDSVPLGSKIYCCCCCCCCCSFRVVGSRISGQIRGARGSWGQQGNISFCYCYCYCYRCYRC